MLHVLNVVHTSFAHAVVSTTRALSQLSQAAACRPHFAATAELFWQNVLRQVPAWLLIGFPECKMMQDISFILSFAKLPSAAKSPHS